MSQNKAASGLDTGPGGSVPEPDASERTCRREVAKLRRITPRSKTVARRLARSLVRLGGLLCQTGRYGEAEPAFVEAVGILEHAVGANDIEVASALNNLAVCYKHLARYLEAGPLYQRALVITERARGPFHPDVATIYHNLGGLEHAAGNWSRGEPFARKSVRIRRQALGPHHPDVAADKTALAALLDQQEKYAEAERLYRQALAIVERCYGPTHHQVAVNLNNLAAVRHARGDAAEAEQMYRRAISIETARLGPRHPKVGFTLNNLAVLLKSRHPEESASLFRRALAIFRRSLGRNHPNVAICLENYASVLRTIGRRKEANTLARRAESILARIEAVNDEAVGVTGTINPAHTPFQLVVCPSRIHRVGVFANEPIPAHRKVIEYTGERIGRNEARRRSNPKHFYLFELDRYWQIDGAIGGSGAEYINHSCEPNLRARLVHGHILYFSKRPIVRGEELTVDYQYPEITHMPCSCGAASCRGTMSEVGRDVRGSGTSRRRLS